MSTEFRIALDAFSGEVTHVIERDRLVVTYEKTARTESVPFASIREINLREEMAGIYSAFVKREGARTLRVTSRHFLGLGRFDDRRAEYSAFVRALLEAMTLDRAQARFTLGSSLLYVLGWILLVMGVLLTAGVAFGAMTRGLPPLRLLFVLPITFFMGFGFVKQGRARAFDPMLPPAELLPT